MISPFLRRLLIPISMVAAACSCPRGGNSDGGTDGATGPCAQCSDPSTGYACVSDGGAPYCSPILASCFFGTCAEGQVCNGGKCACTGTQLGADSGIQQDTCLNYGQTCDLTSGNCLLPSEMQWCTTLGGCQPGLDCVPVAQDNSSPPIDIYRCARPCTSNSACSNPKTTCITMDFQGLPGLLNHCGWNLCPTDSTGNQIYFQSCGTTPATTCLPEAEPAFEAAAGAYYAAVGFCIPDGTALPNADCSPSGGSTNLSLVCPQGQTCVPVGADGGACFAACNYGSATAVGQSCGTNGQCVNASGILFPTLPQVQLGACLNTCDLFGTQAQCAANPSGRAFGCQVDLNETDLSTGIGVCLPTIPNAPGTGGACESDAINSLIALDWPCADRTFCDSLVQFYNTYFFGNYTGPIPGTCSPYCNLNNCPGGQPCQNTCPGGSLCFNIVATDGGTPPQDGFCFQLAVDAGTVDAGGPRVDSGSPAVDAGVPPVDSGAVADAGVPPVDSGTSGVDSGAADAGDGG
jgi:hypothetical protein